MEFSKKPNNKDHRYSQAPANAEEMEEDCSQAKEQQQEHQIPQENSLSLSLSLSRALYVSMPKGFLALCVGEEMKRFVIPMQYLSHRAFGVLLREVGFEQEGVLRIPCDVSMFENVVEMVEKEKGGFCCCSVEADEYLQSQLNHPQQTLSR